MSELRKRKVDVEVVRGVDLDSELALALVKKHQRAALYALCRDSDLDDYGVDYLKGVLLASGFVDEHNVVVVIPRASALAAEASALTTMARLVRRGTLGKREAAAPPRPPATQGMARSTAAKPKFAPMGSPARSAPVRGARGPCWRCGCTTTSAAAAALKTGTDSDDDGNFVGEICTRGSGCPSWGFSAQSRPGGGVPWDGGG